METILTPEQRVERARLAASTRWNKRFDWEMAPLDECKTMLADLRSEAERGGLILQRRMSVERVTDANCYNPTCNKPIDIASGRFAGSRSRINNDTGLMETAYACSAACFLYLSSNFTHSPGAKREPVIAPEMVNNEPAKPSI